MFQNVYAGKKVLVTGHTGFKGSWLTLWLEKMGAVVTGYSIDIPTQPNHFELLSLSCTSVYGDITDFKKLDAVIEKLQPDIIFHLAAQPLVRLSYQEPLKTFKTNIIGTATLLEVARKYPSIAAIVNVTTDKVYENKEQQQPYAEHEPLNGYDPYSASKAGSEIVTSSYRNSFFNLTEYGKSHSTLLASARSGNVIGGGDWAKDRLIPDIVKACSTGSIAAIRNPHATRPWQHVLEPLSGYLLLGAQLLQGRKECATAWNFGPSTDREISVEEVMNECKRVWPSMKVEFDTGIHPHEAGRLQLDSTKALLELDWKNTWEYPMSVIKTIEWYKAFYNSKTIKTTQQLDEYFADAKKKGVSWLK